MVFSVFVTAAAFAADPVVHWSPGYEDLGHRALVSGEFDGHAGLDWAASYRDGDASGIALRLSGAGADWQLVGQQSFVGLRLRSAQMDSDPEEELLVGLPDYGGHGAVAVVDLSGRTTAPGSLEVEADYFFQASEASSSFGWDLVAADCSGDGNPELFVGAPQARGGGLVYTLSTASDGALGMWSLKASDGGALGIALASIESGGVPGVAVGGCGSPLSESDACSSDGEVYWLSLSQCDELISLEQDDVRIDGLSGFPLELQGLQSGSSTTTPSLIWSAPGAKQVLDLESETVLFSVSTNADTGTFLQTYNGQLSQSWMASSGTVWQVEGELSANPVESASHRNFGLSSESIGNRLASAGDLDGDGCEDVLSSSASGEHLWFLSGCEEEEDTGETGQDTGETGQDTGETGQDTGETGDTSEGDDSAEPPCEADFGWRCTVGAGSSSSGFLAFVCGLFCLMKRRRIE